MTEDRLLFDEVHRLREEPGRLITWNRRMSVYLALRDTGRRLRAWVLGAGMAYEEPLWTELPVFTLQGRDSEGQLGEVRVWGCRLCAALVDEPNRAYHERCHLAGSVRRRPNKSVASTSTGGLT